MWFAKDLLALLPVCVLCVCVCMVCVCVCVCVRARVRAVCVCARALCVWAAQEELLIIKFTRASLSSETQCFSKDSLPDLVRLTLPQTHPSPPLVNYWLLAPLYHKLQASSLYRSKQKHSQTQSSAQLPYLGSNGSLSS